MSNFEEAVNYVLANEGGLVENPHDPGGITNFGISLRFLKNIRMEKLHIYGIYDLEIGEDTIRSLTLTQAKSIYKGEFWDNAPFDKILQQNYCNYIFDMVCNMGLAQAIKCVQRACWAVMKEWQRLEDDGILGDKTLAAIAQCGFMVLPPIRAERGSYYRNLPTVHSEEFLKGWYDRTYNR